MNDVEFQNQLGRFAELLGNLKKPEQRSRASLHSDLGRAAERVHDAAVAARALVGSENAPAYDRALVELRRASGAWESIDKSHGVVTWRPGDNPDVPLTVPAPRRTAGTLG